MTGVSSSGLIIVLDLMRFTGCDFDSASGMATDPGRSSLVVLRFAQRSPGTGGCLGRREGISTRLIVAAETDTWIKLSKGIYVICEKLKLYKMNPGRLEVVCKVFRRADIDNRRTAEDYGVKSPTVTLLFT